MSQKSLITLFMIIGSLIGGYIPSLFGAGLFSFISVLTSGVGAILGVWIGFKLGS